MGVRERWTAAKWVPALNSVVVLSRAFCLNEFIDDEFEFGSPRATSSKAAHGPPLHTLSTALLASAFHSCTLLSRQVNAEFGAFVHTIFDLLKLGVIYFPRSYFPVWLFISRESSTLKCLSSSMHILSTTHTPYSLPSQSCNYIRLSRKLLIQLASLNEMNYGPS